MKKIIYITFIAAAAVFGQMKDNVAVMDLVPGSRISAAEAVQLSDLIRNAFVEEKAFTVIERTQVDKIFKEQELQMTGCTDKDCQVEIGRMLSANKMIIGTVAKADERVTISLRLVSVESSETLIAETMDMNDNSYGIDIRKLAARIAKKYLFYRKQTVSLKDVELFYGDKDYELARLAIERVIRDTPDDVKAREWHTRVLDAYCDEKYRACEKSFDSKRYFEAQMLIDDLMLARPREGRFSDMARRIADRRAEEDKNFRGDRLRQEQRSREDREAMERRAVETRRQQEADRKAREAERRFVSYIQSSGLHIGGGYGYFLNGSRLNSFKNYYNLHLYGILGGDDPFDLTATLGVKIDAAFVTPGFTSGNLEASAFLSPFTGFSIKTGRLIFIVNADGCITFDMPLTMSPFNFGSSTFNYGGGAMASIEWKFDRTFGFYIMSRFTITTSENAGGRWSQKADASAGFVF
ncbi:MAG: hypothetical protein HZC28_09070 [Spirochaetes bacterium]|nr:hypothetical protein [Spirochaetota bacterium]